LIDWLQLKEFQIFKEEKVVAQYVDVVVVAIQ